MNVISLEEWRDACEKRDVPFIPIEYVGEAPKMEIAEALWEGKKFESIKKLFENINWAEEPGYMMRWDCCATMDLKQAMAHGRIEEARSTRIALDDPRFFDILLEYPGEVIKVWKRPWIEAEMCEGYPVEFRAFVYDGEVKGVCSYYPQRPLPKERYQGDAKMVWLLTAEEFRDLESGHYTLDWMRTAEGKLTVIEGGPPHTPTGGAHPCCFPEGKIKMTATY